jgi:adenosylmethionine-8-amino-7-oxononanoate aminotransferase
MRQRLEIIEKEGPETIAGFIMEPIMGEHGLSIHDEYFSRVEKFAIVMGCYGLSTK